MEKDGWSLRRSLVVHRKETRGLEAGNFVSISITPLDLLYVLALEATFLTLSWTVAIKCVSKIRLSLTIHQEDKKIYLMREKYRKTNITYQVL